MDAVAVGQTGIADHSVLGRVVGEVVTLGPLVAVLRTTRAGGLVSAERDDVLPRDAGPWLPPPTRRRPAD